MLKQSWTDGIHDLMETLTCRVRVLSLMHLREVSTELFDANMSVMETLQSLIDMGLIVGEVWCVPTCSIGESPLFEWSPSQPAPDCLALEAQVQGRWHQTEDAVPVIAASHAAARIFGSSGGGMPPEHHRSHDLLLSAVYIQYRQRLPHLAQNWLGEDAVALAERGVKNPDAFLFDEEGNTIRVVESAGRYSQNQLESFHEHCRLAGLAYELW